MALSVHLFLLAGVACVAAGAGPSWDPRAPGPFAVASPVHLKAHTQPQGPPFNLWGFLPKVPGEYPVAVFVPGFLADATGYTSFLSRIASYGIAVVGVEFPIVSRTLENAAQRAAKLAACVDYMTSDGGVAVSGGFEQVGGPSGIRLDMGNLILMSHSIGGHTHLHALEHLSCFGAKLAVVLDPVDGIDPYGFRKEYLVPLGVHPEVHLNFTLPIALIMSGHGADPAHLPKILHPPSCAPRDRSDLHWYESLQAPKWLVNVTDFGHAEVVDSAMAKIASAMCPAGPGATTEEAHTAYVETLAGLVVSFAEAFVAVPQAPGLSQDERLQWLEDPTKLAPLRATGRFDRGSQALQAGCRRPSDATKVAKAPLPAFVI